jgi:ribonucleoside-diphosphate reductase alpha chain
VDDVEKTYLMAWELGCKGITVYRAGSREREVLTAGTNADVAVAEVAPHAAFLTPRERPAEVRVRNGVRRIRTGHGNVYVTIGVDDNERLFEVFIAGGKAGGCDAANIDAMTRLVSLALRSGVDPEEVTKQLRGITCCPAWDGGTLVRSVPDALSLALDREIRESAPDATPVPRDAEQAEMFDREASGMPGMLSAGMPAAIEIGARQGAAVAIPSNQQLCPDCHSVLAHEEGCAKCYTCGYSRC